MQVIKVNGKEIELEKATSVEVYLESAGYQMKRIAVELNGEILPKNEYADRMLEDGDCMEVVTFVDINIQTVFCNPFWMLCQT